MKTWHGADEVLRSYSEQTDMEYLFGSGSIHAKYTEFIKERDRKLAEEQEYWANEMRRRKERREQQAEERC